MKDIKKNKLFFISKKDLAVLAQNSLLSHKCVYITNTPEKEMNFPTLHNVSLKDISHHNALDIKNHKNYNAIKKEIFKQVYHSNFYPRFLTEQRILNIKNLYPGHTIFVDKSLDFQTTPSFLNPSLKQYIYLQNYVKKLSIIRYVISSFKKLKKSIKKLKKSILLKIFLYFFNTFCKKNYDYCITINHHTKGPLLEAYNNITHASRQKNIKFLTVTTSKKFFLKHFFHGSSLYLPISFSKEIKKFGLIQKLKFNKNIIMIPHMSGMLQDLFYVLRKEQGYFIGSTPVVTISPSPASTVDWEYLDFIGSTGNIATQSLIANCVPPEKIFLTGNVAYDSFLRKPTHPKNSPPKKIILIATSAYDPKEMTWIERLIETSLTLENVVVVLSPHPSYRENNVPHLKKKYSKKTFIYSPQKDSSYWIDKCSLCFTDFSSVGILATLLKKKLVVVNMTGVPFPANRYEKMGVATLFDHLEMINTPNLKDLLEKENDVTQKDFEEFTKQYNDQNDGNASSRFLESFLSEGKKYTQSLVSHHKT